ncbi:MAG: GNAT family N-acetyltransferase [Arachnia sp.]
MDTYVEDRLQWRRLGQGDLDSLARLRTQLDVLDAGQLGLAARLVGDPDLARDDVLCVGGFDRFGNLLAFGWNDTRLDEGEPRVVLVGGVHATQRYRGIGPALLAWQIAQARAWRDSVAPGQELWLGAFVSPDTRGLHRPLDRLGFEPTRYFYDLQRVLDAVPHARLVSGIDFEVYRPEFAGAVDLVQRRCRQLGDQGIRVHDGRGLGRLDDSRSDQWSPVARRDGQVVGFLIAGMDHDDAVFGEAEGWVHELAVLPEFREAGLWLALLERSLAAMQADGCPVAGIGIDAPDEADVAPLLDELGFETRDAVTLLSLTEPG